MTVFGAFLIFVCVSTFVSTLVLQRKVQAVDQTEEVIITVGRHTVSTANHIVVGPGIGVATKYRQHIGPGFNVIHDAVITAIIE